MDGTELEGRVEVKYRGVWGTVCDDDFGDKEAAVFCSSLGFTGPAVSTSNETFFILLSNLSSFFLTHYCLFKGVFSTCLLYFTFNLIEFLILSQLNIFRA